VNRHSFVQKRKETTDVKNSNCVRSAVCRSFDFDLGSYASPDGEHQGANDSSVQQVNPVVQWNRTLLAIVRTPGAQPVTVHPTRSFAILHAAIYDAVNAVDRTHRPYLVRLSGVPRDASQEAAAAAAAHEVLVALYPGFQATLGATLQQSLAQIPDGNDKAQGNRVGQTVADRILALRSNDGSNAKPIPYVFGTVPGDYQSTPPNFPPQPQFTHWSRVTPFALERASQFRPGPPRRWPVIRMVMLSTKSNPAGS